MRCFICGKNHFQIIYRLKTKNILRCNNDGLYLGEATTLHKNNVYQKDYFSNPPHPPKSNQSYFLNKLATIKLATRNQKPYILDVGCGWGDFEEVLEKEKIPYLGIDTSQEAVKICQEKGLNCKLSIFQQLAINNQQLFSAITMFQVIEHLKNPIPTLQVAKKLLKKNGVILITTPNNDSPLRKIFGPRWSVYSEPSHFVFFNKQTLEKTLQLAGFNRIEVKSDSWRFLSSKYVFSRVMNMYSISSLTTICKLLTTFSVPLPTDPFGDLETIAST